MRNKLLILASVLIPCVLNASSDPREVRHDMMEGVKDATGVVLKMLKGEAEYDQQAVMNTLSVYEQAAGEFGDLFPDGTQEGSDALETVWTDREGFNAALAKFGEAVDSAIAANPEDLAATKAAVGPVLKQCKACHEEYRAED